MFVAVLYFVDTKRKMLRKLESWQTLGCFPSVIQLHSRKLTIQRDLNVTVMARLSSLPLMRTCLLFHLANVVLATETNLKGVWSKFKMSVSGIDLSFTFFTNEWLKSICSGTRGDGKLCSGCLFSTNYLSCAVYLTYFL